MLADAATSDATLADAGSSDAGVTFEASPAPTSNDGSADAPFQTVSIAPSGRPSSRARRRSSSASVSPRIGTEVFNFAASAGSIRQNFSGDAGPGVHAIFTLARRARRGPRDGDRDGHGRADDPHARGGSLHDGEPRELRTASRCERRTTGDERRRRLHDRLSARDGQQREPGLRRAPRRARRRPGPPSACGAAATAARPGRPPRRPVPLLGVGDVIQQEAVAVDPVDASTVYVALQVSTPSAGYEVFVMTSTDGGGLFQSVLLNAGTTPVHLYPDVVLACRRRGGRHARPTTWSPRSRSGRTRTRGRLVRRRRHGRGSAVSVHVRRRRGRRGADRYERRERRAAEALHRRQGGASAWRTW